MAGSAPHVMKKPTLEVGAKLGRYEIVRSLGAGGMGEVYEAEHMGLRKRVALKVLFQHLVQNQSSLQRFLREGEAAARVKHPHVVDVTDVGIEDGTPYLVMELLHGEDLSRRVGRGVLGVQETLRIMLPVLAGVGAAHRSDIIHRDLKPENIFLARDELMGERPVVLDFGVSKLADPQALALTGTATLLGTPYYVSPEQARGSRAIDSRADQYALGVILYECLSGRRPIEADSLFELIRAVGAADYPALDVLRPDLPPVLLAAVRQAMAVAPADRFPTVLHLGRALLPLADDATRTRWEPIFTRTVESLEAVVDPEERGRRMHASTPPVATQLPHGQPGAAEAAGPTLDRDAATVSLSASGRGAGSGSGEARPALLAGSGEAPPPSGRTPSPDTSSLPTTSSAAPSLATTVAGAEARSLLVSALAGAGVIAAGLVVAAFVLGEGDDPAPRPPSVASAGSARADEARAGALPPRAAGGLRFGVSPYLDARRVQKRYEVLLTYLAETLGRPVEQVAPRQYDDVSSALVAGEVDLGMVSSFWYVETGRTGGAVELLGVGVSSTMATSYEGVIITRAGSRVRSVEDLRDRTFCYVSPGSSSGYFYPRALLRRAGIDPDDGFRAVRMAGGHLEAMELVDGGVCDGAGVARYILERDWPERGDAEALRVVASTGRIPYDAVAARASLPPEELEALRAALLALEPGSPKAIEILGADGPLRGYVPIADSDYEASRALAEHLERPDRAED